MCSNLDIQDVKNKDALHGDSKTARDSKLISKSNNTFAWHLFKLHKMVYENLFQPFVSLKPPTFLFHMDFFFENAMYPTVFLI